MLIQFFFQTKTPFFTIHYERILALVYKENTSELSKEQWVRSKKDK